MILYFGVTHAQETKTIEQITESPGIYFNPAGSVKLIKDYMHILMPVEINYIKPHIANIKNALQSAQNLCSQNNIIDDLECQNAFQPLSSMYDEIMRDYYSIAHLIPNRSKRSAWISGIGTIFKHVFGTMDEDDAIKYDNAIHALKHGNQKLLDLVTDNIILSKSAISNFNKSITEINKNEKNLNIMLENLSSYVNNLTLITNSVILRSTIHSTFSILHSSMLSLSYKLEDIVNSVLFAKTNTLHPSIVTPNDLYTDLVNNVKYLPKYTEFVVNLELDNINVLINLSEIVTYIIDGKLIFSLKIPLVYINKYNLYKNIPIPVPHNVTTYKSYALIIPTTSYVALNEDKSKYLTLGDISKCKNVNPDVFVCKELNEFNVQDYPICETEMLTTVLTKLPKECKTNFLYGHVNIWQSLDNNRWIFTHSEPTKLSVECKNQITEYTILGTGILTLKPECIGLCKNVKLLTKKHPMYKFNHIHSDFNLINDSCCNIAKFRTVNYNKSVIKLPDLDLHRLNQIDTRADDMLQIIQKLKSDNDSIPSLTYNSVTLYVLVTLFVIFILYYFCYRRRVAFHLKFKPNSTRNSRDQNQDSIPEEIQLSPQPRIRIH